MSKEETLLFNKLQSIFPELPMQRNIRPDFLKNKKTNNNYEIDIWIKLFSIGFEYQGMIHFKNIYRYKNDSDKSRYNDVVKSDLISSTDAKTIIEVFPSDLLGDFKLNIEKRIYNTIINSIKTRRDKVSIKRLIFFYLYLVNDLTLHKIKMRTNRLVYYENPKEKIKLPYQIIDNICFKKDITLFNDLVKTIDKNNK